MSKFRMGAATLALFLATLLPATLRAHADDALVVNVCGTLPLAYSPGSTRQPTVDINGRLCDIMIPAISSITGSVSAATITSASAQLLAAASRKLLSIDNESATATIACAFGATAAINTAGSFTIVPGATRIWNSYPVPADAVNCISSAATSPATVEAN